ncbi:MAG: shikimate dehydrogenase [Sedimentisphaerales bacterium]|nr:shikimate dehydrogenase [Sedimentisphaerales bacterium]
MTYLAVPISAQNPVLAREQAARAVAGGAEMLELRTDYLEGLTPEMAGRLLGEVRDVTGVPIIVTCRDRREGGAADYPESLRLEVLTTAVEAGAEFVDAEFVNFRQEHVRRTIEAALAPKPGCRLIVSAHDFDRPFADVRRLRRDIVEACPQAIPKLVYTAGHINDCFAAFDLLHEVEGNCIVLCMGPAGVASRLLAPKLGGLVTFASLDEASGTAPGQVTLDQFRRLYRYDTVNAETELFGVIADPVGHSLSPAIHNACFADLRMNRFYLPLLVQGGRDELFTFLDNVWERPWLDFRGFSVTIPHKHSALEYVHARGGFVEPLADKIGAANTLVVERRATSDGQRLAAYNTDYAGALDAIEEGMGITRCGLRDMPVAVVGAGGVARALVAGLTDAGANVTIYNRTIERAEKLAADFGCASAGLDALPALHAKLIINCTSIGMSPKVDARPVPSEVLKPDMAVFDTVYNPAETLLLKQAKAAGAKTIDGVAMFVNQAMAQFKLFTGQTADSDLMRNVVLDSLR